MEIKRHAKFYGLTAGAIFCADTVVGLVRIELTTSSLSVTRSNRLSYSPAGVPIYTSVPNAYEVGGSQYFADSD
jgi:hypothetical protein